MTAAEAAITEPWRIECPPVDRVVEEGGARERGQGDVRRVRFSGAELTPRSRKNYRRLTVGRVSWPTQNEFSSCG